MPVARRALGDRERAAARAQLAAERQLAEDRPALERLGGHLPAAARMPTAIARSNPGPALRRYAGARFAVIRCCGNSKPEFWIAARTRSRASRTALSPRPTIVNAGRPAPEVDLDGDPPRLDAVDGEGGDAGEHGGDARRGRVTGLRRRVPDRAAVRAAPVGDTASTVTAHAVASVGGHVHRPPPSARPARRAASPPRTSSASATRSSRATTARGSARSTSSSPTPTRSSSSRSRRAAARGSPWDALARAQAPAGPRDGRRLPQRRPRPPAARELRFDAIGVTFDAPGRLTAPRPPRGGVLMQARARAAGRPATGSSCGAAARRRGAGSPRGARASSSRRATAKSQPGCSASARRM